MGVLPVLLGDDLLELRLGFPGGFPPGQPQTGRHPEDVGVHRQGGDGKGHA